MMIDESYFSELLQQVNKASYNHPCSKQPTYTEAQLPIIFDRIKQQGFCVIKRDELLATYYANSEDDKTLALIHCLHSIFGPSTYHNGSQSAYEIVTHLNNARKVNASQKALPSHTDGGHQRTFPRYIGLEMVQRASQGGDTIMTCAADLLKTIHNSFSATLIERAFLSNSFTFTNRWGETYQKPLLYSLDDGCCATGISYQSVLESVSAEHELCDLFFFISDYIHDPSKQTRFSLQEGDVLLLDNLTIIHGRTRFMGNRELRQFWFKSHAT